MSDSRHVLLVDGPDCDLRATAWLLSEAGYAVHHSLDPRGAELRSSGLHAAIIEPDAHPDALQLAGDLLASGKATRVVFYTECDSVDVLREATRIGPVVHKADGPQALVAALRIAAQPMSGFPGAALESSTRTGSA